MAWRAVQCASERNGKNEVGSAQGGCSWVEIYTFIIAAGSSDPNYARAFDRASCTAGNTKGPADKLGSPGKTKLIQLAFFKTLQYQACIGAAKTEVIAHDGVQASVLFSLPQHRHAFSLRVQLDNVGRACHEIVFEHEKAMNRLLDAGSTERMSTQRLA